MLINKNKKKNRSILEIQIIFAGSAHNVQEFAQGRREGSAYPKCRCTEAREEAGEGVGGGVCRRAGGATDIFYCQSSLICINHAFLSPSHPHPPPPAPRSWLRDLWKIQVVGEENMLLSTLFVGLATRLTTIRGNRILTWTLTWVDLWFLFWFVPPKRSYHSNPLCDGPYLQDNAKMLIAEFNAKVKKPLEVGQPFAYFLFSSTLSLNKICSQTPVSRFFRLESATV